MEGCCCCCCWFKIAWDLRLGDEALGLASFLFYVSKVVPAVWFPGSVKGTYEFVYPGVMGRALECCYYYLLIVFFYLTNFLFMDDDYDALDFLFCFDCAITSD